MRNIPPLYVLISIPGYFLILLLVMCFALRSRYCRHVLLFFALPQLIMAIALAFLVDEGNSARIRPLFFYFTPILCSLLLPAILIGKKLASPSQLWLIGHIFCVILLAIRAEPLIYKAMTHYQEVQSIKRAEQQSFRSLDKIQDNDYLVHLLEAAIKSPDTSEQALSYLSTRAGSPFVYGGKWRKDTLFSIAISHYNERAVRVFCRSFMGETQQAQENRTFLQQYNPLDELYLQIYSERAFNDQERPRHIAAARNISATLLEVAPELLTENVYENVIHTIDSATLELFWRHSPPKNSIQRLKALALIPKPAELVEEVRLNPALLQTEDHSLTALGFMARFADAAVIRTLIEADVIDWQQLMDPKDETLYLAALRLEYDRDSETFILLVKNLVGQQAKRTSQR